MQTSIFSSDGGQSKPKTDSDSRWFQGKDDETIKRMMKDIEKKNKKESKEFLRNQGIEVSDSDSDSDEDPQANQRANEAMSGLSRRLKESYKKILKDRKEEERKRQEGKEHAKEESQENLQTPQPQPQDTPHDNVRLVQQFEVEQQQLENGESSSGTTDLVLRTGEPQNEGLDENQDPSDEEIEEIPREAEPLPDTPPRFNLPRNSQQIVIYATIGSVIAGAYRTGFINGLGLGLGVTAYTLSTSRIASQAVALVLGARFQNDLERFRGTLRSRDSLYRSVTPRSGDSPHSGVTLRRRETPRFRALQERNQSSQTLGISLEENTNTMSQNTLSQNTMSQNTIDFESGSQLDIANRVVSELSDRYENLSNEERELYNSA